MNERERERDRRKITKKTFDETKYQNEMLPFPIGHNRNGNFNSRTNHAGTLIYSTNHMLMKR